jgi:hypothetical protein
LPEQLVIIAELIETNNDATLEELCHLLHQKIGVTISFDYNGKNDTTVEHDFQKKTLFPSAKGSERVQNLRYEFWQQINQLNVKNLIFIDESRVNLAMVRLYARPLKGSRAKEPKPNRRGKNVSILGAISVKKVLTSVNLLGSIDGITFEAFIIRKLVPKLWKGACVLMDNYSIHKGEEIEKAIKKAGAKLLGG